MQIFNPCVLLLMVMNALLVSACGTSSLSYDQGLQRAALSRWSQCIDRQTPSTATAIKVVDALETQKDNCQGHKRDVVETYPPHLGSRVEQMLQERRQQRATARLLDVSSPEANAQPTLLVRGAPTH